MEPQAKYRIGDIILFFDSHYLILDTCLLFNSADGYIYLELESGKIKPGMAHYVDKNSILVA